MFLEDRRSLVRMRVGPSAAHFELRPQSGRTVRGFFAIQSSAPNHAVCTNTRAIASYGDAKIRFSLSESDNVGS